MRSLTSFNVQLRVSYSHLVLIRVQMIYKRPKNKTSTKFIKLQLDNLTAEKPGITALIWYDSFMSCSATAFTVHVYTVADSGGT